MILSSPAAVDRTQKTSPGYLQIAARRKLLIGLPIAVAAAFAYLMASSLPPQYVAEAMLALDTRKVQVVEIDAVVSRLPQENAVLRTELDALSSRSMAARVAEQLDLVRAPAFLDEIYAPRSSWQRLTKTLKAASIRLAPEIGAADPEPDLAAAATPSEVTAINWLLNGLRVSNDGRSFTIRVSFVAQTAELATEVANAFAEAYLADQIEIKVKATRAATAWLQRRLEETRRDLEASESAVQEFRREADLLEVSGDTMAAQQLDELNSQLISARNERLQLEAQLLSAKQAVQSGRGGDAFPDVLTSATIQTLRTELSRATVALDQQRNRGALRHPTTIALESDVASLNRQLAAEIERARRSLESAVGTARNREADVDRMLRELKGRYGENGESVIRLNQLQREAEANRVLYESLLNRYKQTLEQETLATPEARLLSRAVPPGAEYGPRRLPVLVLGVAIGAAIGAALAVVLEWLDRSLRRVSDLEEMTGVPVFGLLPRVARRRGTPQNVILTRPRSQFGEALRQALVAFHLSRGKASVKVVMVTSATSGEGKTAFCVASARALALSGARVLVIDADLQRPRVAAAFGRGASGYTGDVVRGSIRLEDAVSIDTPSGAHFLAAVPERGDPWVVTRSDGFAALIGRARDSYDLVIVDTPPVLVTTDAAALGAFTDANLLVVRWGKTPRAAVLAALRLLGICRIAVAGVVMTQVDLRRQAKYGDGYDSPVRRRALSVPMQALPSRFSEARFEQHATGSA